MQILYRQIAEVITKQWRGPTGLKRVEEYLKKLDWLLSKCMGFPVQVMTMTPDPSQQFTLRLGERSYYTVVSTFNGVRIHGPESEMNLILHDLLQQKCEIVTPDRPDTDYETFIKETSEWLCNCSGPPSVGVPQQTKETA